MQTHDTDNAAANGLRNASMLSAIALVLAFAFGVGGMSLSFGAAAQQLLPDDDASSLLADLPEPHDPIFVAHSVAQSRVDWAPAFGASTRAPSISHNQPYYFCARAPPLTC